jgi:hypothetical protein
VISYVALFSDVDKNPPNPVLYMILSMPLEPNVKTRYFCLHCSVAPVLLLLPWLWICYIYVHFFGVYLNGIVGFLVSFACLDGSRLL